VVQDRAEAQRQADGIRTLQRDLTSGELAEVLVLSSEQKQRFDLWAESRLASLGAVFDLDRNTAQGAMSWGARIASALGGFALAVSLVLLFQRYWGFFDTWMQVFFVILAPAALLAGAEYAARRERTLYFASLLSLVSLAAFALNLVVLGQVFNIAPSERALLAWGVFAVALAYRYGQRLHLTIGLFLLVSYGCAFLTSSLGYDWLEFGARPEYAASLALILWSVPLWLRHAQNPAFESVYRTLGISIFFIAVVSLAEGNMISFFPFAPDVIRTGYRSLGLVIAMGAIWLGIRRQWPAQVNLAAFFFCGLLVFRLHAWWWAWMPSWLFFGILGLFGVVVVIALRQLRRWA